MVSKQTCRLQRPLINNHFTAIPGIQRNVATLQQLHSQQGLVDGLENADFISIALPRYSSGEEFKSL